MSCERTANKEHPCAPTTPAHAVALGWSFFPCDARKVPLPAWKAFQEPGALEDVAEPIRRPAQDGRDVQGGSPSAREARDHARQERQPVEEASRDPPGLLDCQEPADLLSDVSLKGGRVLPQPAFPLLLVRVHVDAALPQGQDLKHAEDEIALPVHGE